MTRTDPIEPPAGELYRAVWRWRFYFGLVVMPVLMLMALTGGRLAAPPASTGRRAYAALGLIVLPLAVLYPLVGATAIAALILDLGVRRLRLFTPAPAKA